MIRLTVLLLCAALVAACASVATRVVRLNPAVEYPPTSNVEVLFELPSRPYLQIAMLEAEGQFGTSEIELLEDMRQRAQALGADAIVRTESARWYSPPIAVYDPWYDPFFYPRRYYGGFWPYGPPYGDYRVVGGGYYYTAKATAIKYQPASPSAAPSPAPGGAAR